MVIENKVYENGLRLILEKNEKNVISANIMFYVGSNNENENEEGFSHFIEHLVFKSSKKFSTETIMDKLTFLGADFNAYTSKTSTKFVFKCLKENFKQCFEIYSDMLLNPLFLEEELNKEREVVIEEMKKYEDEPTEVMFQRVLKNYFDGTSFAHDILGNEKLISSVSRDKLLKYKSRFYKAENAVISVCGNIDMQSLDEIVKEYFASQFNYKANPTKVCFDEVVPKVSKIYDIVERNDSQANVCLHIKAVPYSSNLKYVCDLFTCILGNSQNSKLYKEIRENLGLVYTIYAYNEIGSRNGEIYIAFGTRPKNVRKAIVKIREIIDDFAKNGASEEELQRAKNWKKSCIEYNMETNSDIAESYGSMFLFDNIKSAKTRKEEYEKVTLIQINNFAKRIASEKIFNVVAVGKDIKIDDLKQFDKKD